jgi:hypothetical protein
MAVVLGGGIASVCGRIGRERESLRGFEDFGRKK